MRKRRQAEGNQAVKRAEESKRIRVRMELAAMREAFIQTGRTFAEMGEAEIAGKKLEQARLIGEALELL